MQQVKFDETRLFDQRRSSFATVRISRTGAFFNVVAARLLLSKKYTQVDLFYDKHGYYFKFSQKKQGRFGHLTKTMTVLNKLAGLYISTGKLLYPFLIKGDKSYCHYELAETNEKDLYKLNFISQDNPR